MIARTSDIIPFERTVCGCPADMAHCTDRPGYLIGTDLRPLGELLVSDGRTRRMSDVLTFLRASSGAIVKTRSGELLQIGTIAPKLLAGRCVFLDSADRCTVHAVSPFGCRAFDAHMDKTEADRRSTWGLHHILRDPHYHGLREDLIRRDRATPVRLWW